VRELQNVIQRALVVADGPEIQLADLPERVRAGGSPATRTSAQDRQPDLPTSGENSAEPAEDAGGTLEDVSKNLILATLAKHQGNASAAMRELSIGRTRFYRMLKKFDLEGAVGQMRRDA
jgi:DNA-binding NtrC family response regulator